MENNKQEMKFANGMTFKARHEKAPETVRGSIYFKASDFTQFLEENKDEKGWVHVKMMKSKDKGTIYFILDTWKPTPIKDDETGETIPEELPAVTLNDIPTSQEVNLEDIPF